uniref:Probable cytosolic iron-sulfur protein assembly protein CIAO1 homolog n=1 Tax=Taenia asiatica TaxID=60517 RepID=A0A0R3WC30_TAEAS
LAEAKRLQTLSHHEERVWCVAWNNVGTILASCGEDKSVCLWVTEGLLSVFPSFSVLSLSFMKTLPPATSSRSTWTCAFSSTDNHIRTVRHVSWSPSDRYLATASFDSTVAIFRVEVTDGVIDLLSIAILEGHTSEVKCVAWSLSGYLLATCGRDKSVWIWEFDDEEDFQCVSVLQPHTGDVKYVFWHPIKEVLGSTSYDNTINLYKEELDDWTVVCKLIGHESTVWKAEFSPNGQFLASVSEDTTIKLWHELPAETSPHWVCFKTLVGYHTAPRCKSDELTSKFRTPCGQYLATCGGDDSVYVFRVNLTSGNLVGEASTEEVVVWLHLSKAHGSDVNCLAWRPKICEPKGTDQKATYLLATAGDDRQVNLWSVPLDPDSVHFAPHVQSEDDEFDACAGIKRSPVDLVDAATDQKMLRIDVVAEQTRYIEAFSLWNEDDQVELFCLLLSRMSQTQQSRISNRIRFLASHQRGIDSREIQQKLVREEPGLLDAHVLDPVEENEAIATQYQPHESPSLL